MERVSPSTEEAEYQTGDHMRSMKGDKTGPATSRIMKAVAETKPDLEVHGFAGAAENMPGGAPTGPMTSSGCSTARPSR